MSSRALVKKYIKQAERLRDRGKLTEARELYFKASRLNESDPCLWAAMGEISERLDHPKDTEFAFRRAVALNPNTPNYYLPLGRAQLRQKNFAAAEQSFNSFTMLCSDSPAGYLALGGLMRQLGDWARAEQYYHKAMELQPGNETTLHEWSDLLRQLGRYDEALEICQRLQTLQPDAWETHTCLAAIYQELSRFDEVAAIIERAYQLHPQREADYYYQLGVNCFRAGDRQQALQYCDKVLELKPQHLPTRMMKAYTLLSLGQWQAGWAEYEWRLKYRPWQENQSPPLLTTIPLWQGESLPEATILVEEEEGYGDNIHFCRYLPLLARRCGKVLVRCRPALEPILQRVEGVAGVVPITASEPGMPVDRYVHMMSLPHLLEPEPARMSDSVPYLAVDPDLGEHWRQRIKGARLKIGLVWAGNPTQPKDVVRSIPLSQFQPLAAVEGVTFYSLQKGPAAAQLAEAPFPIVDLAPGLADFSSTAAAIAQLDLVITVDTAVCHLAGALGRPVWTLLYFPPDWRWQLQGDETLWYPSMRLFRQGTERRWAPVIQEVAQALAKY